MIPAIDDHATDGSQQPRRNREFHRDIDVVSASIAVSPASVLPWGKENKGKDELLLPPMLSDQEQHVSRN